jgi:hypothetical protein
MEQLDMPGPNWKLDDDGKTVTLTIPTDPPVALQLDASQVDAMLQNLGLFRGSMQPDVPAAYALGQKTPAIRDPAWVSEPEAMMGDSLLHIRDPRFGWLHYIIPKSEAKKLADFLQIQAAAPPPPAGVPH